MKQLPTIMKVVGIRTKEDMVIGKVPPHKLFPTSESCDSFTSSEEDGESRDEATGGEGGNEPRQKGRDKKSVESQNESKKTQDGRQEGDEAIGNEGHDEEELKKNDDTSLKESKRTEDGRQEANDAEFVKYQGSFGKEAGVQKEECENSQKMGEVGKKTGGAQEETCDVIDEEDKESSKTSSEVSALINQTGGDNCCVADSEEIHNSNCDCDNEVDVIRSLESRENKNESSVPSEKKGADFDQEKDNCNKYSQEACELPSSDENGPLNSDLFKFSLEDKNREESDNKNPNQT